MEKIEEVGRPKLEEQEYFGHVELPTSVFGLPTSSPLFDLCFISLFNNHFLYRA